MLVNVDIRRDLADVVLGRFNTGFEARQKTPYYAANSNAAEHFLWLLHRVEGWCVM